MGDDLTGSFVSRPEATVESFPDLPLTDPEHPFHLLHMEMALEEADLAAAAEEVPVGAVIVERELGVIARAHNLRETLTDPTAHAEMIAITQAAAALRSWRLEKCILYVTLEPCPMCAGAIVQARVPFVVYGCTDPKAGACDTLYRIPTDPRLNHRACILGGVLKERCAGVLSAFFKDRRAEGRK
jgi:tRNA(adenine34) deaminase